MELHLGSLFAKAASETDAAKLYDKLNELLFNSEISDTIAELEKWSPKATPLKDYLCSDTLSDLVEELYFDLLREGTPLSEKDQHKLRDYYGYNEATSSQSEGPGGPGSAGHEEQKHLESLLSEKEALEKEIELATKAVERAEK